MPAVLLVTDLSTTSFMQTTYAYWHLVSWGCKHIVIDIAYKYGSDFDVVFNPNKSICMVTKLSKFHLKCPTVTLNDIPMIYEGKIKYMCVFITSDVMYCPCLWSHYTQMAHSKILVA